MSVSTAETAASGAKWTVAAMIARQVGRLGFVVVLARMLGPTEFAVAAAATIYITFTAVLLETGLASGIVQKDVLRKQDEGATFWTMTGIAALLSGLTVLLAVPVSDFLGIERLAPVLAVLAIGPLLKGFTVVASARLQRELRFRVLGLGEVVAVLMGAGLGIAAAMMGASYWALVVQQVATDLIVLAIWLVAAGLSSFRADREGFRHVWRFGVPVMVSQGIGYATRSADNVIISRFLGETALSFYMVPYRIMLVPVGVLGTVANRVAFPIISRIQDDKARIASIYLAMTRLIAAIAVPAMVAAAVLAPELIETVFGPEWLPAVPVLIALAATGIFDSLTTIGGSVFMGLGRADMTFRWSWIPMVVTLPAFFAGLPWGVVGVAAAYSLATMVLVPFRIMDMGKVTGFTLVDWLRALWPPTAATAIAAAAGWLAAFGVRQAGLPVPLGLVAGSVVIGAGYLLVLRLISAAAFTEIMTAGRLLARGKLAGVSE